MKINSDEKKKIRQRVVREFSTLRKNTLVVQTPFPLTTAQKESMVKKIPELSTMTIKNEVNPALIGGFILRLGSHIYDASVDSKITAVIQSLL